MSLTPFTDRPRISTPMDSGPICVPARFGAYDVSVLQLWHTNTRGGIMADRKFNVTELGTADTGDSIGIRTERPGVGYVVEYARDSRGRLEHYMVLTRLMTIDEATQWAHRRFPELLEAAE